MYVITHHHDYDEVLLGPIDWKPSFIASVLQQDLDLPVKPTILTSDVERIPFDIIDRVRVRPVKEVRENINPKIQRHEGPFWSYTESEATASYTAVDKSIDQVKSELRQITSTERYRKEVAGVKTNIQGTEVTIDTSREGRNIFAQKFTLMVDQETVNWKFPEGWLTLSKADLGLVVAAGAAHIQSAFDWEMEKNSLIDACTNLQDLDAVVIVEPTEEI